MNNSVAGIDVLGFDRQEPITRLVRRRVATTTTTTTRRTV